MNLIDFLKKIGVLRIGSTKGVYRNADEKPDGLVMDEFLDNRKKASEKKTESD